MTTDQNRFHVHTIATSANGKIVYADLTAKSLAITISRSPHLLRLAEEGLQSHALTGSAMLVECNLGRPVGYSELIATEDTDPVFYARRTKTAEYTRFVKNRQPGATTYITVDLARDAEGNYELRKVWLGRAYPAAPTETNTSEESKAYWLNHAFAFTGQELVSSTLTKSSPY